MEEILNNEAKRLAKINDRLVDTASTKTEEIKNNALTICETAKTLQAIMH